MKAVIGLRIIVSDHQDENVIQKVIDQGCIPLLLDYINKKESLQMQLEATWILTNIDCGSTTQCESIINKNGL